jgi:hypothetical protein
LSEEAALHVHRRRRSRRHGAGRRRWAGSAFWEGKSPLWIHKMTKTIQSPPVRQISWFDPFYTATSLAGKISNDITSNMIIWFHISKF